MTKVKSDSIHWIVGCLWTEVLVRLGDLGALVVNGLAPYAATGSPVTIDSSTALAP